MGHLKIPVSNLLQGNGGQDSFLQRTLGFFLLIVRHKEGWVEKGTGVSRGVRPTAW